MTLCTICGHRPHTCVESPSGEAAPPPAGVLLALLEAGDNIAILLERYDPRAGALDAWQVAKDSIYTAAPPTLSAEVAGRVARLRASGHQDVADMLEGMAARAPVTPTPGSTHSSTQSGASSTQSAPEPPLATLTDLACGFRDEARAFGPCALWAHHVGNHKDAQSRRWKGWREPEPATVEPCGHRYFSNVEDSEQVCAMPKGHDGLHRHGSWSWPQEPAPEPARPPAVTREEFDALRRAVRECGKGLKALGYLVPVEAEARRDADRRETR